MTFLRYVLIQIFAYGIDMCVFFTLLHIGVEGPVCANIIAKVTAGLFAFVAHRHLTFRVGGGVAADRQAIRYFTLLLFNIPVASVIMAYLLMWFTELVTAKFMADIICIGLTFLLSKNFIFIGSSKKTDSAEVGV